MPERDRRFGRRIIIPGTSIKIGGDGAPVFRERGWRDRAHVHIGSNSERKTRDGRTVRYLQIENGVIKGVTGVQQEDRDKGFPW